MASRNTHVRVSPETHSSLVELARQMEASASKGRGKKYWRGKVLTLAELIAELTERELAHRRRTKEAGDRRRTSKVLTPVTAGEDVTPAEEPTEYEPMGLVEYIVSRLNPTEGKDGTPIRPE